jgi:putative ABC transport system permease protein
MDKKAKKGRNLRSIFWLLCLKSLQVKRPQAILGIGSLVVGAAVCSLLLNLYGGVQHKMTESFRSFGPNVIFAPREAASQSSSLPSVMEELPAGRFDSFRRRFPGLAVVPVLYVVAHINPAVPDPLLPDGENVLAVGANLDRLLEINPDWRVQGKVSQFEDLDCLVGSHLATEMRLHAGDQLQIGPLRSDTSEAQNAPQTLRIRAMVSTGTSADDQVFVPLAALQQIASLTGKISSVDLRVPGDVHEIESAIRQLAAAFPGATVRPVRQIVYSQGRVLATIRRLMLALTALILVITALCVAATMTAIVIERRKDVAVMKSLGASERLVMELFLSEGAVLGLLGGVTGFFIGALFARGIAWRLFHVPLAPSWWVFPVVTFSTMVLAVAATMFPVRIVRRIQPAVALKGA